MSAWILGLALSAGYLINKNLQVTDRLEQATTKYQSAAKPADPGPTSKEIRTKQGDARYASGKSGGEYDDFNQGTGSSRAQMNEVVASQKAAAKKVEEYETQHRHPEIQGVMLVRDNYGI